MTVQEPWNWFVFGALILLILLPVYRPWLRKRPASDPKKIIPYKPFTREYDVEIRADQIAAQVNGISADHARYWRASGHPEWEASLQSADRFFQEFRAAEVLKMNSEHQSLGDTAVTFLLDHSGSMRDERIQRVAASILILVDHLSASGATVEVLGFTTAGWKGGFARKKWLETGKPRYPGRLCALMHIIYKSAEDKDLSESAWRAMLNPGILYENIDGEALAWAEQRLLAQPQQRKLLVMISDGAPVDDSTLMQNGPSFLERHIREVIKRIESEKNIKLVAVGVGHHVDRYYSTSVGVENLDELYAAIMQIVSVQLARKKYFSS